MMKDSFTPNLDGAAVKARAKAGALDALRGRKPVPFTDAERATVRVLVQEVIAADNARLELELTRLNAEASRATLFLNTSQLSDRARQFLTDHF